MAEPASPARLNRPGRSRGRGPRRLRPRWPRRACGGRGGDLGGGRGGRAVLQPAALAVVLGVAADRGERSAQFVARVAEEAAHPFLGMAGGGLGLGARPEGRFDMGQHHVQRGGEPAHLGPGVVVGHPAGQVARRDGLRRVLDLGQRPQAGPDHRDAHDSQRDDDDRADHQVDLGQPADRLVEVAEVGTDDQDPGHVRSRSEHPELVVADRAGQHPPGVAAAGGREGDELLVVGRQPGLGSRDIGPGSGEVAWAGTPGATRYLLPLGVTQLDGVTLEDELGGTQSADA